MSEKITQNTNRKPRVRNRRRRPDNKYSSFAPVSMLPVPDYPVPKELLDVLMQNRQRYPGISEKGEKWLDLLKLLTEMKEIQESNYLIILKLLLYLEEYYNNVSMEQFNLHKQRIRRTEYSTGQFIIRVPGLAEDRPSLMPNDIVDVYEVPLRKQYNLIVTFVGQNYVTVRTTSPVFMSTFSESKRYNVKFRWPNWPVRVCHYAVGLINKYKLTPLLHPVPRPVYNKPKDDLCWFDKNIKSNPEQMQAVQRILGRTAYPSPYLVFGPPGTGKTATIVEAISQIWQTDPSSNRILVCTPSNAAADEITKRLVRNMPENLIYRMFSPSRDSRDVDESIHVCSNFVEEEVIFIPKELLIKKKIVITTLVACMRLISMNLWESHFSYIFLDEAGQATQPETLIPIGLMSAEDEGHIGRFHAQLVMSGDPKQLGPVVMTKLGQHLLGKSMLERFMDCFEIYQKGEKDKYDPNFITKLVKNYRSHEAILRLPNQMFYDNELVPCGGQEIYRAENWSELPNKNFPIIFHAVHGLERRDERSPSVCNQYEVDIVMAYISKLVGKTLGGYKVQEKDIGIVTPFRLQRSVILKALEQKGWDDVSVGTVEIFQGQEKDVIILSTVRSVLFHHDGRFHIGFLSHNKRFNVAITRAKALLIVIGNPKVLQIDSCWREFIEYCQKNGACVGDEFSLSEMSTTEKQKLLLNRLQTKYQDTENSLPINEEEILATRVHPLPENNIPQRRRRLPKVKTEKIERDGELISPCSVNGTLEADSGVYSSSNNSITIEERFDVSMEFGEEVTKNSGTLNGTAQIEIDDESSRSYSSAFSSDNEDCDKQEVFELAKEIDQVNLTAN